jgi:hypothetical protein
MAKIKITKEQANLLGLVIENNTRKLKITKEQYDRLFVNGLIKETEVKGGLNRVDSEFKKAFNGKITQNVKSESETESEIEKPIDLENETEELIKYLYRKSEEISPFWVENGLSFDDITKSLLSKGIIISKNGKFEISKKLGNAKIAISRLKDELGKMLSKTNETELDESDWFDNLSYHPSNQSEPEHTKGEKAKTHILKYLGNNNELAIFKDSSNDLYVVSLDNINDNDVLDYANREIIDAEPDGEGGVDYKYADWFLANDPSAIFEYVNDNLELMTKGVGYEDFYNGLDIVKLDSQLKQELINIFDKDKNFVSLLGDINENHDEILNSFKNSFKKNDNKPEVNKDDILQKLADIRKASKEKEDEFFKQRDIKNQEYLINPDTKKPTKNPQKKRIDPIDPNQVSMFEDDDIIETTTSDASGQFIGKLSMDKPTTSNTIMKTKKYDDIDGIPVVGETLTTSGAGNFQYDTPGGLTMDLGKSNPKSKAEKVPQWAGGSFVKQPECSKPNNNKEAQNGGCNSGASSLRTVKTKGSINAPSLSEGIMREALKLQHNKADKKLIVVSDLEGRAASQETFNNKVVLKQNGFIWTGTNWAIPVEKLDVAKKTLSLINKADYLIDTLEDLEEAVDNSGADNKSLLKAKLDQYISDLANATDEAALSSEIRRYLTFFSKFHDYSFHNRMLIFIQKPDATKVASYKTWQSKHRQVNKGAKAITVLAPINTKSSQASSETDDEISNELNGRQIVTRFRAVSVFDISDTSPIDERGNVPDTPQWWGDNTPSETADMLFKAVSEVVSDMGIKVTQSDAKGGEKGYSAGDHINISSDVEGAGRLSTMIHEIAHELMHWKKSSLYYQGDDIKRDSAIKELQAESVSYVVLKHYGLPVSHHTTYLALWKANKEKIQNNLEVISKVSQFIITKIDEEIAATNK